MAKNTKAKSAEARRKEVEAITQKLEAGVAEVFTSDGYKEYLTFMGKFYNYSFNNTLLILMQCPHASLVAGYKAWSDKFKRQVRKGEKAIRILAPCPHKKEVEDEDGNVKVIRWTTYKTTCVFDISQTDGDGIPSLPCEELTGDVDGYGDIISRLETVAPVPVGYEDIDGGSHGYFHTVDKRIAIQQGMSEQQTVKTLVHEIAHSMLHDKDDGEEKEAARTTKEVQAESVAFTVCNALGLDTSDYSFGYIAGWSAGKDTKELTASMEVIRKTAVDIIEKFKAAKVEAAAA